jgi:hypothetical protein
MYSDNYEKIITITTLWINVQVKISLVLFPKNADLKNAC